MLIPPEQTDPLTGSTFQGLQTCAEHFPADASPLSNLDPVLDTRYQDKLKQELKKQGRHQHRRQ